MVKAGLAASRAVRHERQQNTWTAKVQSFKFHPTQVLPDTFHKAPPEAYGEARVPAEHTDCQSAVHQVSPYAQVSVQLWDVPGAAGHIPQTPPEAYGEAWVPTENTDCQSAVPQMSPRTQVRNCRVCPALAGHNPQSTTRSIWRGMNANRTHCHSLPKGSF